MAKDERELDIDLVDFAIKFALKNGAKYADARLSKSFGQGFVLKNGVPEIAGLETTNGLNMRLLASSKMSFIATNELTRDVIKALIKRAVRSTNAVKLKEKIDFSKEQIVNDSYTVNQKINLNDIDVGEKINAVLELEQELKTLANLRLFSYSDLIVKKYFANSEGSRILSTTPYIRLFYMLMVSNTQENMQSHGTCGGVGGFELFKNWNLNNKLRNDVLALKKNLKGIKIEGKMDAVCAPRLTGIFVHESVGHPTEADRILSREAAQAGESFITKKMLGKNYGSAIVNVVDDPTIENSFGFFLYDDEGVKARRKYLIKNGKLNEFLHNRETAFNFGIKSNASSRSSEYDKEPITRMSNTFLLPSNHTEKELIESTKHGVYIVNFEEWNIDDKRWQQKYVGNEAYLIKNGRLDLPVKRPVIEITTPALWSSVDAVANNLQYDAETCGKGEPMQGIPVTCGGPTIRLKNILIKKY